PAARAAGRPAGLDASQESSADCARPGTEAVVLSMELDRETAEALQKLKGQSDWSTLIREFLTLREEKLAAEMPEPVVTTKRYIPVRIKNHVLKKNQWAMRVPGVCKDLPDFSPYSTIRPRKDA
ncbi:MAG: hypothetical protein V1908_04090, partial [Candidatus Peregrinibacteria bacterium]